MVLLILRFILMIGFLSALASLGWQPEPMVKPASTLVIDLSVPIMDRAVEDPMAIFTSFSTLAGNVSMPVSLREMTETIAYAALDENIEGISLTGEGFGGGMAQLVAIRQALDEFKASGKYVTSYANLYSQGDYIVKSLADKVFLNPNGTVDFKGMSMTSMFFKGFEQKYGVQLGDGPWAGRLSRAVVIIDTNGKVIYQQLVDEITHEPDYESAISALR